ncbi:MAG TPA: hypothetical protein VHI55_13405 [Gaiellaceae bacterium]|jgi:hypothetical protein|nr:hypothetical protein [Gaiellaceae bacterium]
MSLLASLSPDARDELRAFVQDAVRQELAARERADARDEWVTMAEAAKLLGTTDNALRLRRRRGWMAGDTVKDGKVWLVRRSALLEELDRRAGL